MYVFAKAILLWITGREYSRNIIKNPPEQVLLRCVCVCVCVCVCWGRGGGGGGGGGWEAG